MAMYCAACDVGWTVSPHIRPANTGCWNCGQPGTIGYLRHPAPARPNEPYPTVVVPA